MTQAHIADLMMDYVLGLLPADKRQSLEQHVAQCEDCRHSLLQERQLQNHVQQTLSALPVPTSTQLIALRPPIPTKKQWRIRLPARSIPFPRQLGAVLVTACLIGFLMLTSVDSDGEQAIWQHTPSPSSVAVTATSQPTFTATYTRVVDEQNTPLADTPMPAGTPIAALSNDVAK